MKFDPQKSEIGLLYGLIAKVRAMILLKEMLREGWVKPDGDYNRFKLQLERVPAERLPEDKRYNPLSLNAYVLFKALPQAQKYSRPELVRAMELLLQCNQRLISSNLDERLVLQQALMEIVGPPKATGRRADETDDRGDKAHFLMGPRTRTTRKRPLSPARSPFVPRGAREIGSAVAAAWPLAIPAGLSRGGVFAGRNGCRHP